MNKELFVITCIRGDETTELGKYLLKAGWRLLWTSSRMF